MTDEGAKRHIEQHMDRDVSPSLRPLV